MILRIIPTQAVWKSHSETESLCRAFQLCAPYSHLRIILRIVLGISMELLHQKWILRNILRMVLKLEIAIELRSCWDTLYLIAEIYDTT